MFAKGRCTSSNTKVDLHPKPRALEYVMMMQQKVNSLDFPSPASLQPDTNAHGKAADGSLKISHK